MRRFFGCFALIGTMVLGLTSLSKADVTFTSGTTVWADRTSLSTGSQQFNLTYYNNVTDNVMTADFNTNIGGVAKFTVSDLPNYQSQAGNTYYAFSADIQPYADGKSYQVGLAKTSPQPGQIAPTGSTMGPQAAGALGYLFRSFDSIGTIAANGQTLFDRIVAVGGNSAAAFQLATWKLVFDSTSSALVKYDLGAGNLNLIGETQVSGIADLAQSFLDYVASSGVDFANYQNVPWGLTNQPSQMDYLTLNAAAVPEPATLAIWGAIGGFGAIFATRFNRKRQQLRLA